MAVSGMVSSNFRACHWKVVLNNADWDSPASPHMQRESQAHGTASVGPHHK